MAKEEYENIINRPEQRHRAEHTTWILEFFLFYGLAFHVGVVMLKTKVFSLTPYLFVAAGVLAIGLLIYGVMLRRRWSFFWGLGLSMFYILFLTFSVFLWGFSPWFTLSLVIAMVTYVLFIFFQKRLNTKS